MQLRSNLLVERDVDRFGDPIIVICDPLVRRFFSLPAEAEPVLERLRMPAELPELVRHFGEVFGEDELDTMVRGLAANHLLEEGLAPDALRDQLKAIHRREQWQALQRVVRVAGERVPIYRRKLREAGLEPEVASPAALLRVPCLEKAEIKQHYPDGFVPDGVDLESLLATREVRLATSSGTSAGERLQMIFTTEARGLQMAAGTALNEQLNRLAKLPQAVLTSMHCADPDVCVRYHPELAERVRDGNRLLLIPPDDPGAPELDEVRRTLDELRAFGVRWLDCNPTYLATVTYAALDAGLELPRVDAITCGFEFLTAAHRALFEQAWGCDVFNRYTASEVGNFQIVECHHHSLHVNDRYFYAELVRDGRPVAPGEVGRLVQTTLHELIPLIRYDTGDLVVAAEDRDCACGSAARVVGAIAGRATDLVAAVDGSPRTTRDVDLALGTVEGLRFYQLAQTAPHTYQVKVVAAPGGDAAAVRSRAVDALAGVLGAGAEIRADAARHIYPEASGKFRITRSSLPDLPSRIAAT